MMSLMTYTPHPILCEWQNREERDGQCM